MPSSRTDALQGIATRYRGALEALLVEDLERLGALLDEVDELLHAAGDPAQDEAADRVARESAWDGYRTLLGAVHEARTETREALAGLRIPKRAMAGYGNNADPRGSNLILDV